MPSYLTLLIGPGIPIPAPEPVTDALQSVQVTSGPQGSGFQLTFGVSKKSLLTTVLLPAGYFDPVTTRVIIIATVSGIPVVLMDGFVMRQEMQPSDDPGKSTLTITGNDLSVAMNLVEKVIPFPAMPLEAQIALCLAPYAALGVVPLIIPPIIPTVDTPTESWKTQRSTDLDFINGKAAEVGYIFFVRPGPIPGQSIAYFGPDINLPIPQPAISIDLDAHSNADSLSFSLDGNAKKIKVFTILDPITHKIPIPIPLPNVDIFKPPLGLRPVPPSKILFETEGANKKPDEAAQQILGFLMHNEPSITVNGSTSLDRYGWVLQSRMLVGVRGGGIAYDGMYYVDSVTHNIKQGEFKQSFTLSRDGLISQTPVVVP
jgi:hypothetical protein